MCPESPQLRLAGAQPDSTLGIFMWLAANREKILRYAFVFQFLAALPFLLFAYSTGQVHTRLLLKGAATTGTVVASVPVEFASGSNPASSRRTGYEAVVVFLVGEDQFRFQEWKATRAAPSLGARVPVIYDPADPDIAMVDRGYWNYLPWAPCAAIGGFLALVAFKGLLSLLLSQFRIA